MCLTTTASPCSVACHSILRSASETPVSTLSLVYVSDTGQSLTFSNNASLTEALAKLDSFAEGADFLLGHNLIAFDLPHLKAANPGLRLLRLPAVDTLRLNPLAFPRNPYHHLVKHYQDGGLRRGRINDPELDARLALEVFDDQLKALGDSPFDLLTAWHWLTTSDGGEGFDGVFSSLRNARRQLDAEASDAIHTRLADNSCQTRAQKVIADAGRHGWALAYALAWLSVSGGSSVMPPWGAASVPRDGSAGQTIARHCLHRLRLWLVPRATRCSQRAYPLVRLP